MPGTAWRRSRTVQSASVRSDLAIEIYDALQSASIEIPFPQREVRMRSTASAA